uniref:Uncharacterized protein n=1 Tax=Populus alba TaxID=43335 RepID=A0A4U5PPH2_POPAL|nr:uncharacterized protein D5086_0000212290 [Populus alba]
MLPVDPWAPNIDSQSLASQLFAFSLFPYIGFLYFITKSKSAPKLTLFGVYFLLAFVGATRLRQQRCIMLLGMQVIPEKVHEILFQQSKRRRSLPSREYSILSAVHVTSAPPSAPMH